MIFVAIPIGIDQALWLAGVIGDGFTEDGAATLATDFATHATTADLDGDGYIDIVTSEDPFSFSAGDRSVARVYWGSAAGHSADDSTELPVNLAWGTAAFDMDGDDYLELAIASYDDDSTDAGVKIFFGGEDGYAEDELVFPTAPDFVSQVTPGDVNSDGFTDLLVAGWGTSGSAIY